ncbi:MAG: transferase, partial [Dactylosporangium sp.]|nr:transferase [Dactylosporangium sp.]
VSAALYLREVHFHPIHGADLRMYRAAAQALRDGEPIYGVRFDDLPFTSPPVTAVVMLPTTFYSHAAMTAAMLVFGLVGTFLALLCTTRVLGQSGLAGRIGLAAAVTALMLWTEPFQTTFLDGQLNVAMLLLVLADLAQSDRNRFKGAGVGVAAALKLVPALFVVYLLLTRRLRAAATAVAVFLVFTAVGWIVEPDASATYWFNGGLDSHNVLLEPRFVGEQALQGTIARLLGISTQSGPVWMFAVTVVGIGGLALATWAQRSGFEAMGVVVTGLVAVLVSPSSWSHYWVWIAPLALVLIDVAVRSGGRARTLAAGLPIAAMLPFFSWDLDPPNIGPMGPIGLIWTDRWSSPVVKVLVVDSYAITTLALFVLAALWLYNGRKAIATVPVPRPAEREAAVLAGQRSGPVD